MDYQVILSPRALRDLEEIVRYIATDNPQAATKFGFRLIEEAELTGSMPFAGRVVPEFKQPSIRERIVHAFRIVYRVDENQHRVVISRFWHAARDIPEL